MTQVEQSRECGAGGDAREGCHLPRGTGKRCWLLASPHLPSPYPLSCFFTHHPSPFKFKNVCGVNSICSDGDSQRRCLSEGRGSPALHTMLSVKHPSPATATSSSPLLPPFLSPLQASRSSPSHHNLHTSLPTKKTSLCPCPNRCSSGLQAFKAAKSSVPSLLLCCTAGRQSIKGRQG